MWPLVEFFLIVTIVALAAFTLIDFFTRKKKQRLPESAISPQCLLAAHGQRARV
jgi:hypothetical protein